jgi:glycosyltransferase involved in cell wall biosynthesis
MRHAGCAPATMQKMSANFPRDLLPAAPSPVIARDKKICVVTTTPLIVDFFLGQHLKELSRRFDVTLVCNTDEGVPAAARGVPLEIAHVPMERDIAIRDAAALVRLYALFRRHRAVGVVSVAPKAGLLTMIAAWLAGVPFRCHIFQGEVWATQTGIMRWLLRMADRLTARLATDILVVSRSERDFLVREGIVPASKSQVLSSGSIAGVDTARFRSDPVARTTVRQHFGIGEHDVIVLFLGRLKRDKGVLDLVTAWRGIAARHPRLHLLFVGPDEDELRNVIEKIAGAALAPRLHFEPLTPTPERYLAAADILCLPSYREGFGCTLIEAGAVGLPVITSRIYGVQDAVIEGETALLHAPGAVKELADRLDQLVKDEPLRRRLGDAGHARARDCFDQGRVVAQYVAFFEDKLCGERR